jgi:hypothetical protein
MNSVRAILLAGFVTSLLIPASMSHADSVNASSTTQTSTVRQQITDFANRYGESVIIHDGLNLDAPIPSNYDQSRNSDDAIAALALAAGGSAVRVYFVTPAIGSTGTTGASAARLIGGHGLVTLDWHDVSARAAIEAVAQAANAKVRFPDGAPLGSVTYTANGAPLDAAIAYVAAVTKTRWTLGYLVEPTNESDPSLTTTNENVIASLPALKPLPRDAAGNILPFTVHINLPPPATPGDATSVASTNTLTPQQIAREQAALWAQQQYYGTGVGAGNIPQNAYNPSVVTFPSDQGASVYNNGDAAVQTIVPGNSGFHLDPGYGYGY